MSLDQRTITEEDVPALTALDALCFAPDVAYGEDYFRELVTSPENTGIVYEDGGRALAAFALWAHTEEGFGHVITIDVHPDYRRQGLGKKLMGHLEAHSRSQGSSAMLLEVAESNRDAAGFYAALGYVQVGTLPDYYGEGAHAHLMWKKL